MPQNLVFIDFFQDLGIGHDDALGHATKTLLTIRSVKLPRVVSYPIYATDIQVHP